MNWKIPFSGRSHKYTNSEIDTVVDTMRLADPLTQGRYRNEFERKFSNYLETGSRSYAVCNATAALELAAQLCQFDDGDEVIIPAHTFTSTAYPFVKYGAKIVWADIDSDTHVVTADTIHKCITDRTKAVVVVHLYGYMADMRNIIESVRDIPFVIEDAAQALGTKQVMSSGRREITTNWYQTAGTFGDFGAFSLHSHKNITTLGEGGILLDNKGYDEVIPMLRHNGHCGYPEREDYWIPAMGNVDLPMLQGKYLMPHNFCLGEVECALGTQLLKRIDIINYQKRTRAIEFIDALADYPQLKFHREPTERHNYHLLVAEMVDGDRDEFMRKMAYEHGIQCVVQYMPLYRYPLYQKLGLGDADCPVTDKFYDNMVSFPFQHSLNDGEIDYMLGCVKESLE